MATIADIKPSLLSLSDEEALRVVKEARFSRRVKKGKQFKTKTTVVSFDLGEAPSPKAKKPQAILKALSKDQLSGLIKLLEEGLESETSNS